jgi:hypothetical protein
MVQPYTIGVIGVDNESLAMDEWHRENIRPGGFLSLSGKDVDRRAFTQSTNKRAGLFFDPIQGSDKKNSRRHRVPIPCDNLKFQLFTHGVGLTAATLQVRTGLRRG